MSFAMRTPDFLCSLAASFSLDKGLVLQYEMLHRELGGAMLRLVEEDFADDDWLGLAHRRGVEAPGGASQ